MKNGLLRPPSRAGKARHVGLAAATALLAGLTFAVTITPAHAEELSNEAFSSGNVALGDWIVSSLGSAADHPCLTAAKVSNPGFFDSCVGGATDAEGNGVFRFTSNAQLNGNAGALMLNKEIDARKGLTFEFDMYQYAAKPFNDPILGARGGDGISFYLVDGKAPASVGKTGGWLGYKDLVGAFVGVGFDAYGNFSNPKLFDAGTGAPAGCDTTKAPPNGCVVPNAVVVRGAQATKYAYVQGVQLPKATQALSLENGTEHNVARRHAVIDIGTNGFMDVSIRFEGLNPDAPLIKVIDDLDLNNLPNQPALPDTVKIGFAASTGSATAKHAISDFEVRTLDADLKLALTNDGPWKAGDTGSYTATVSNSSEYGWSDNPLQMKVTIPEGVTPKAAAGEGWTCKIEGQDVTCDSTVVLKPGDTAPPVKIDVEIPATTSGTVTATGHVDAVTDEAGGIEINPADNTATSPAEVEAAPVAPDLSTAIDPGAAVEPGGTGTITATVSNADGAGPSTGPVTVTYNVPEPLEITGAAGDGWTCTIDGQTVKCTRPGTGDDALAGGDSYPPVKIDVKLPEGEGSGPKPVTAVVETPGDSNPDNNTATAEVVMPVVDPVVAPTGQLAVDITSNPSPYVPGKPYTYTVTVDNTGTTDVKGAKVVADWPTPWDNVKWTCTSQGGACPAASGVGDLNEVIDLAAGGKMTFKVTCVMPEGVSETYTATASVTAADTNCTEGCSASDENAPAPARKAAK